MVICKSGVRLSLANKGGGAEDAEEPEVARMQTQSSGHSNLIPLLDYLTIIPVRPSQLVLGSLHFQRAPDGRIIISLNNYRLNKFYYGA